MVGLEPTTHRKCTSNVIPRLGAYLYIVMRIASQIFTRVSNLIHILNLIGSFRFLFRTTGLRDKDIGRLFVDFNWNCSFRTP